MATARTFIGAKAGEARDAALLLGQERIRELLVRMHGEQLAAALLRWRAAFEDYERDRRPSEGLRERKKRLTRQIISDVATTMFLVYGFDRVRVAQIAEIAGVSEKTAFNYFPTKESMVFDMADEELEELARALRDRRAEESPARVIVEALQGVITRISTAPADTLEFLVLFSRMVTETPALAAAGRELQDRLVTVLAETLAEQADVDPREPEPMIAARALVGLRDVVYAGYVRHIEDGLADAQLHRAVRGDLDRAARLVEAGLWSFHAVSQGARTGRQLREAARAAESARVEVLEAVREARAAWREVKRSRPRR